MPAEIGYLKSILIGFDQLGNAILGGWPDETFSSRCWRWHVTGKRSWPKRLVDGLFCWDTDKETGKRHCEMSFESERYGRQLPPECRN